jgi:hypothetical protein
VIVFTSSARIAPGKSGGALAFAHELAEHVNRVHDVQLKVLQPLNGNRGRVAWSSKYESLEAMQAMRDKLAADQAYWAMRKRHSDDFVLGSVKTSIWQA